jgi:8-oxo-dGTP pyrophosphatase MutT (NUDIX family)
MLLLDRPLRNEVRLPKGHIDRGETPERTAIRETVEETGYSDLNIVADLGRRVVEFDFKGEHVLRVEHYYLMELTGHRRKKRTAADEEQFHPFWAPIDRVVEMLTFAAEREIAARAIQIYQAHIQRELLPQFA